MSVLLKFPHYVDFASVTSYINKCIDDVTVDDCRGEWALGGPKYGTARAKLSRAIRAAKHAYSQRIHSHLQDSGDTGGTCGRASWPSPATGHQRQPVIVIPPYHMHSRTSTHDLTHRILRW